jgi:hypothetical protein
MMHGAVTAADLDHCNEWLLEGASRCSSGGASAIVLFVAGARDLPMISSPAAHGGGASCARRVEHSSRTSVGKYAPPPRQRAWQVARLCVPRDYTRCALVPCVEYDRTSREPRFRRARFVRKRWPPRWLHHCYWHSTATRRYSRISRYPAQRPQQLQRQHWHTPVASASAATGSRLRDIHSSAPARVTQPGCALGLFLRGPAPSVRSHWPCPRQPCGCACGCATTPAGSALVFQQSAQPSGAPSCNAHCCSVRRHHATRMQRGGCAAAGARRRCDAPVAAALWKARHSTRMR